jgi:hypothetical protein
MICIYKTNVSFETIEIEKLVLLLSGNLQTMVALRFRCNFSS